MTIEEACVFFENVPKIYNKLKTLNDVGLGYIKLGQPATELSGGEAQRVKLATELSKRSTGKSLYILDEPTTGLAMYDVDKLIKILNRLVANGNTIVVIEHNLDVIKIADYIIDLSTITDTLSRLSSSVTNNDYDNAIIEVNLLKEYSEKNRHIMGFNMQNLL